MKKTIAVAGDYNDATLAGLAVLIALSGMESEIIFIDHTKLEPKTMTLIDREPDLVALSDAQLRVASFDRGVIPDSYRPKHRRR